MSQVRVGVVGYGYWGPNLVRNFVELPDSDVVIVADLDKERLSSCKKRHSSIEVTTDFRDCFAKSLDAMVVVTPPATHFSMTRDCLEHGLHVLVEKPMTLNSQDGKKLVEIAEQRGLTLMVGHTFEYNPAVRALKEIVESGELGEIHYVDAVRVNLGLFQNGLNVLWDLAPHDISILRYILGCDPSYVRVNGTACIFKDVPDVAYLYLQFPNQVMAHIHVSWLDPCKVRRITVVGSKKMLVYDDVEALEKIRIYDKGVEKPPYTDTFGDFQLNYRYGDIVAPHIRFMEPLRLECQHFIDSIINNTKPQSSGRDGLLVVKVLEMAQQSLEKGGTQQRILHEEETDHEYAAV